MLPPSKTGQIPNTSRSYLKATYLDERMNLGDRPWVWSLKIDGVRLIKDSATQKVTTRNGEEVPWHIAKAVLESGYNDVELFAGSWNDSISVLRGTKPFVSTMIYGLTPLDTRLFMGNKIAEHENVNAIMNHVVKLGHEGLVLRQGCTWIKVVPEKTADVKIVGFKEGTGRLQGTLGSIETTRGFVGSGIDDAMRDVIWANRDKLLGRIVECLYRELHSSGKFRFARFSKLRLDKQDESI